MKNRSANSFIVKLWKDRYYQRPGGRARPHTTNNIKEARVMELQGAVNIAEKYKGRVMYEDGTPVNITRVIKGGMHE